jgi:hypothetical protein
MQPIFEILPNRLGEPILLFQGFDYKAPHALRGTPKKPRRRPSSVLSNRLFKGHRA